MSATLTKGAAVVRLGDGVRLGTVDRLYLDPKRKEIAGFSVRRGPRWWRSTVTVVDASDVRAFGPDAVMLAGPVETPGAEIRSRRGELVDLATLFGRAVVTAGGTVVGRVSSFVFDQKTRRLRWLEVEANGYPVPGLVWGDEVLRVGAARIVVADAVLATGPAQVARPVAARGTDRPAARRPVQIGRARPLLASA